ncbi:MAG: ATP-dependent zinc metalloprotease FtsH [Candidatus Obscuribacterales bacterium]
MPPSSKKSQDSPLSGLPYILFWWLGLFLILAAIQSAHVKEIPYSQFLTDLKDNRITEVRVRGTEIQGRLKQDKDKEDLAFKTVSVPEDLSKILSESQVKFTGEPEGNFWSGVLSFVVPFAFIMVLFSFISAKAGDDRGPGGGLLSIGRSRARVYVEEEIKVTFADVAGVEEAKDELKEIVTFLKEPERYKRLGGKMPKGILLVGPPGTGKTLLARAVAGEAGVPFFSISGSEFVELFVGVGAARVRDLFERAKAKAPCIIFIDELDALGRARGIGPVSGSHDEKEQTLNQLLSELDGFDTTDGVVLLAATNRPEILDPALLRAGRFDRQVLVDRPDKTGRKAILDIHMRGLTRADDIDVDAIAAMTPGFTGADLANLVNEATLLAARRNAEAVTGEDFDQAIERIIAGLEKKNRVLNPEERRVVAFHEMGHALVSMTLPGSESVQKVSIIPRGIGALGYTLQRPTEDRFLMSRQELLDKMAVLMGGRAAESLIFKDISTGAADDFVKATAIARNMVARYGMNKDLGMVAYEEEGSLFLDQPDSYHYPGARMSEETAREIDLGVRELVGKAFERATGILTEKVTALHRGAELLLEKETLQKEELEEIFASDTGSAIRLTNFGVPASSLVEIDSETE